MKQLKTLMQNKVPLSDGDYVIFYAENLRERPELFKQHKLLIDSQIKASREIFLKKFGRQKFKENARKYLREIGLI